MEFKFYYLIIFFLFASCKDKNKENEYFHKIALELRPIRGMNEKIKAIAKRENEKFKKTNNKRYLLSSKFVEIALGNNDNNHANSFYDLMKLNNDQYEFLTSFSNFGLALEFEYTAPKLAMNFIDKAINLEEGLEKKYFLSHQYHAKGRFYYNDGNYSKAIFYFKKALKATLPNEPLYIASMHNNFGMTYLKLNRLGSAIKETKKGIETLEKISNPNWEEVDFLYIMKGNLGAYLIRNKQFEEAENYLLAELNYYKGKELGQDNLVTILKNLQELYEITRQVEKEKKIIDHLMELEHDLKKSQNKIIVNEILQKYYMDHKDLYSLKITNEKLLSANHLFDQENSNSIKETSYILNDQTIRNIDDKYNSNIKFQKKIFLFLMIITILIAFIFTIVILNIGNRNKKTKQLLESNAKILEQDIRLRNEKIRNLHQNLHLKMETEKVFLENLRRIKKTENVDPDQLLTDLHIRVTNLIHIDKRYEMYTNESSIENKLFMENLSKKWPTLTPKELKLCTYFRMDLSSKEISSLENTTTGTIRVYKTKIRSKLGIPKNEDFVSFLSSV